MPRYMTQFSYSAGSIKAMVENPQDRRAQLEKLAQSAGGELLDFYLAFGDYDGVAIWEFSSNADVAAAAMAVGSTGAAVKINTTVLITMEEAVQAMEKAKPIAAAYRPPA